MADSALRELLAVFGIKVDDKELKEADKGISALAEKLEHFGPQLAKIGKTIGEAFGAEKLKEFVAEGIEAATHVQNLASRLDVSATVLQQFGDVAKSAGIDFDGAANSLGLLQKNLGDAQSKGGETAQAFARLGINAKEAATTPLPELLGQISEGLAKLPNQNQRAAASMQLFGRAGRELLPILGQGKEKLEEMLSEVQALGSGLGDKFYADAKRASEAFEHFEIGIRSLKERALDAILPAVEILGRALTKLVEGALALDKNTHLLSTAMVALAAVIAVGLVEALSAAAAAAWVFLAPFLAAWGPIIAAVGALIWVIQDLWNLMTGGKSALGDLIEKFGGVEAKGKAIGALRELWDAVKDAINNAAYATGYFIGVFAGLGKVVLGTDAVSAFFSGLVASILAASRLLVGFVQAVEAIPKALKTGSFEPIGKAIDKAGDAVFGPKGIFGGGPDNGPKPESDVTRYGVPQGAVDEWNKQHLSPSTKALLNRTKPVADVDPRSLSPATRALIHRTALGSPGGGRGGHQTTIHQENKTNVEVHTASDQPKAVGDAVGAGVATSHEKSMNAALASVVKP